MRMMTPVVMEKSCLACHKSQGYKEGQIRGGISIIVPLAPYEAIAKRQIKSMLICHLVIGFLGLLLIFEEEGVRIIHSESMRKLQTTEFQSMVESHPGLAWLKDKEGHFLRVNSSFAYACGEKNPNDVLGKTSAMFGHSNIMKNIRPMTVW